jgi:hypothetical protein
MTEYNPTINLRVMTKDKQIHEYRNVIEYVQGKLFFYVLLNDDEVATHPTDSLAKVIRFNDETDWPINLKKRFTKDD